MSCELCELGDADRTRATDALFAIENGSESAEAKEAMIAHLAEHLKAALKA